MADPRRKVIRIAAFVIGAALFGAAIFAVVHRRDALAVALDAIADLPAGERARYIITMLAAVLGNLALTGAMFSLLTARYGRVGGFEMQALIASATLLNYLPLRPGVIGRVAYHKSINRIAVRDAAKVIVQAAVISAACAGLLAILVLIARERATASTAAAWTWTIALAPPALFAAAAPFAPSAARTLCLAGAVRYVDVLVTAARYHAAFALIGAPIDFTGAIAFACISVLATMVPLVSNGLGLREWAVGLLAPAIASYHMDLGITADLVNRAAELAVVIAVGQPATWWLTRHVRRRVAA